MSNEDNITLSISGFLDGDFKSMLIEEFEFYNTLNLIEAIDNAVFGRRIGKDGLQYFSSHYKYFMSVKSKQWNLKKLLYPARNKLLEEKVQNDIKASKSFLDIYKVVQREIMPINGLGKLFCYDVSLRIGNSKEFSSNYLRPKHIFIQTGAEKGARALFGNEHIDQVPEEKPYLEPEEFNQFGNAFNDLEPYLIECFLCIKKDEL